MACGRPLSRTMFHEIHKDSKTLSTAELSAKYKLHPTTVLRILSRNSWNEYLEYRDARRKAKAEAKAKKHAAEQISIQDELHKFHPAGAPAAEPEAVEELTLDFISPSVCRMVEAMRKNEYLAGLMGSLAVYDPAGFPEHIRLLWQSMGEEIRRRYDL